MAGEGLGRDEALRAAEDVAPVESVDVAARNLEEAVLGDWGDIPVHRRDQAGRRRAAQSRHGAGRARGEAEGGCRLVAPGTNREAGIGVLSLVLSVAHAAHVLTYVVRDRFTTGSPQ
ncbi:hypothetical protein ACWC2T_46110 [Streptomyces sp. NPDC001393]